MIYIDNSKLMEDSKCTYLYVRSIYYQFVFFINLQLYVLLNHTKYVLKN